MIRSGAMSLARSLDSEDVFQVALTAAERAGAGMLRAVLVANARKFSIGYKLPGLMLRHPDEDWSSLVGDEPDRTGGVAVDTISEAERLRPRSGIGGSLASTGFHPICARRWQAR